MLPADSMAFMALGSQTAALPATPSSDIPRSAYSPLALHVGSSSVSIQHGIVGGFLNCFAVQLDGLSPQLASKGLVGLLLDSLQVWRQLHLGTEGKGGKQCR